MRLAFCMLLLSITACNREQQPEAPTPAESGRLDEAEEMLNDMANEEGPTPEGTGPSTSD